MDFNAKILQYLEDNGPSTLDRLVREIDNGSPSGNSPAHFTLLLNRLIKRNLVRETDKGIYVLKPEEPDNQVNLF